MKWAIYILLSSVALMSFSPHEDTLQYNGEKGLDYSIRRTAISKTEYVDEKTVPLGKGLPPSISRDTFMVKNNDWYIKEFGKYQLFLGPESFKRDSIFIHLDLPAKWSDWGFENDTDIIFPASYVYHAQRKIEISKTRPIYVYEENYYINNVLDDIALTTIFFDPEFGIVKTFNLSTGTVFLKNYPYLDSLKNN